MYICFAIRTDKDGVQQSPPGRHRESAGDHSEGEGRHGGGCEVDGGINERRK